MASTEELDRLINSLPEQERVNFLTKKFREMPLETRYQIFQEELGTGLKGVVGSNTYLDDIALQIQTCQDVDIPLILELLVEHHRRKKSQGN